MLENKTYSVEKIRHQYKYIFQGMSTKMLKKDVIEQLLQQKPKKRKVIAPKKIAPKKQKN